VRAEIGKNFSDWSVGLAVKVPEAENWALKTKFEPEILLAVQRSLLRMCAARGDVFAVLNMPEHFDEPDVFTHVGTLKATKGSTPATKGVEPFSADETRALSCGAMYHPWLLTHEEDFEGFRSIPPDGAMVGVMAKRSFERGAWIAPANESLKGVIGLAKDVKRERFLDFQDNLINLVRQESRGFLVLDSDTLCDDFDWRSINVRRLIGLLRRLATKHGAEYVFEPNDERFRRQVERGFASLLDLMFVRGAFAGNTPANSYQVVVSSTINNFQSLEQGRFIVELRVAPSLPLKFVTVRLIQAGGRSNVTEVF
jgi:phage tail sheath protein FI